MNKAKEASKIDGRTFLRDAFVAEQEVLRLQLALSSKSITHNGVMGEVNEAHFIEVLRKYLPNRYGVAQGIVVDCNGATSDQIDIIIFDPQYTPTLLDQQSHRFVPAEAVYAVLEAKPSINKQYLDYAANKAASVRRLERTSVPIRHAGGEHPAKALFPIIAGIVATDVEWADGCASKSLIETLGALTGEREINLGIALSDCAFQVKEGSLHLTEKGGSLAAFLFLLLGRLQALGTVPAVDWERYGAALSGNA
ncbi:DUF6602 domain-containing protein [Pseudomonas sp. 18173]|uniref:DUF6602 domain-containing protein n=1 Tax=Pseudomonas sp. 18173 TaxID=3390055 RepID=UPI003D1A584E